MNENSYLRMGLPAIGIIGLVAISMGVALNASSAEVSLLNEALIYGLVAISLTLLMGYGGQTSLGQAGFLAVGGYTTAIVARHASLPFPILLLIGGAASGIAGGILGLPALRLRGYYLAIVTFGFGVAIPPLILSLPTLTGGENGLIVPAARIGTLVLNSPLRLYVACIIVLALAIVWMNVLVRTRSGRRFFAVRDHEIGARVMGINVWRTKITMFMASAFLAGIAGGLLAYTDGFLAPDNFGLSLSLSFFAAVVIGGIGSMTGALIGSGILVGVNQLSVSYAGVGQTALGMVFVVILLLAPNGLVPLGTGLAKRLHKRALASVSTRRLKSSKNSAGSRGELEPSSASKPVAFQTREELGG